MPRSGKTAPWAEGENNKGSWQETQGVADWSQGHPCPGTLSDLFLHSEPDTPCPIISSSFNDPVWLDRFHKRC